MQIDTVASVTLGLVLATLMQLLVFDKHTSEK